MNILANLFYDRVTRHGVQHKRIGSLWYDAGQHRASILLEQIYLGQFAGKIKDDAEPVFLRGDIACQVPYESDGEVRKKTVNMGWAWTTDNETGSAMYHGVITSLSIKLFMNAIVRALQADDGKTRDGIWLSVLLDDAEHFQATPDYEGENQDA